MMKQMSLGGSLTFGNTSLNVNRMGYGAMQLADPGVWSRSEVLTVILGTPIAVR
jgi:hypothetical protein